MARRVDIVSESAVDRLAAEHRPAAVAARHAEAPRPSYLRDMVYGAIDGTVTTYAVVAGVAGGGLVAPLRAAAATFLAFAVVGLLPLLAFVVDALPGVSIASPFAWATALAAVAFIEPDDHVGADRQACLRPRGFSPVFRDRRRRIFAR